MLTFILRRLLTSVPMLLAVVFAAFALLWLLPGDPTVALLGEKWTEKKAAEIRKSEGLDDPIYQQFGRYVTNVVTRGDLGTDLYSRSINKELGVKLPATLELGIAAMCMAVLIGIGLGILSALKPGSWRDMFVLSIALTGVSFPVFWLGLLVKRFFRNGGPLSEATGFEGMPQAGRLSERYQEQIDQLIDRADILGEPTNLTGFHLFDSLFVLNDWDMFVDALTHLALPAVVLATIPAAIIMRITRTAIVEQLQHDYTRTAIAKGATPSRLMFKHVLRNAMIPIVTSIGTLLGYLVGGAVLTERIFSWPGMGNYMVDAIIALDARPLQASVLIVAVSFVAINLAVDISYGWLDPRVRAVGRGGNK
jgi:ABC-type dipeptide/oligopeptide/nickel transport system permease component